jgi:ABC-type glycerol-3-phosphate transport system substrate-binding protein
MTSTICCRPCAMACRSDGKLYAAPFYGESSMLMYRKDLADKAGVKVKRQTDLD